jgi:hypothetical protein
VGVTSLTYSQNSGTLFPIGVTTVTVTARDAANNIGTATFTVTVRDTTAPVVTPPANLTIEATGPGGAVVTYPAATATDAVGVTSLTYSQNSGTLFPIGVTVVTIAAMDAANNVGTATFSVTINPAAMTPQQVFTNAMTTAGLTGPNAALDAVPHGDGVKNLLKYAFNMNLSGPDSRTMSSGGPGGLPVITTQPNGPSSIFRYEFVRRIGSGLIYTPQKSPDITNSASWVPLTDTPTIIPIDATWERVIYEEPYDAAITPKCFGRVHVTLPP